MDRIFRTIKDFFIKERKIVVTRRGLSRRRKITASRISYLFKINPESLSPYPKNKYKLGERLFEFEIPKNHEELMKIKRENRENKELPIIEYINKQLNKKFEPYPLDVYDVFCHNKYLGGVPDGSDRSEENSVDILEIKTTKKPEGSEYPSKPYINHQLQLALYTALSNRDVGYLCLCRGNNKSEKISPKTNLSSVHREDLNKGKEEKLTLNGTEEDKSFIYRYRIIDYGENSDSPNEKLCLFKIQINRDDFMKMMEYVSDGFFNLKFVVSPDMSDEEFSNLMVYLSKVEDF